MRTKTLLVAAAALAATVISSQAQVYSGVVGYMNIVTPAGQPTLICNPLDLDGVDNITNILPNVPKGTVVQVWNGAGFTGVSRAVIGAGAWSANAATTFIKPGQGFFLNTPQTTTNTFVGSVSSSSPATNTITFHAGIVQLVGSPIPFSGTITNAADQGTNTLNLGSVLPKGTVIQIWNGNGYTGYSRALVGAGNWSGNPTISAGEGFFINSPATTNWVQTLQ